MLNRGMLEATYVSFFTEVNKSSEPLSLPQVAERFLTPYDSYARTGVDPSGDSLILAHLPVAQSSMVQGLASGDGEQAFKSAVSSYWAGAMFGIVFPPPGMSQKITSVVTSLDISSLDGMFDKNFETPEEAATEIAWALDGFTRTVQVTITGLATAGTPPPVITIAGAVS